MQSKDPRTNAATPQLVLSPWRIAFQIAWRLPLFAGCMVGVFSWAAGRWDLWAVWVYALIFVLGIVAGTVVAMRKDPTLLQERMHPGPGGKDPHLRRFAIAFFLGHWVLAGFDVGRFYWSGEVPVVFQVVGLVLLAGALAMPAWAMSANRFFSSEARIQRDRGHQLVTGGPYRFIRHPGYAGTVLLGVASPLALGSYLSFLPMLGVVALILRRLVIEENLLREELEGYAEYMQRVRFRVIPGVW